jgi:hypothetical protein
MTLTSTCFLFFDFNAAVQTIAHVRMPHKNPWFDEECRLLIEKKNEARKIWLQKKTRNSYSTYKRLRTEQRHLIWRKKTEHDKKQFDLLSTIKNNNEVRKFYKKVENISKGCKPATSFRFFSSDFIVRSL